jgi:hypothetical protein
MAATELTNELFHLLTGETQPTSGDFWKKCKLPGLTDFNVAVGVERTNSKLPDRFFPYILIDIGDLTRTDRKYVKQQIIYFDIGVKVENDVAIDKVSNAAELLSAWIDDAKYTNALIGYTQNILYTISGDSSKWVAKRYATINAAFLVNKTW